MQKIRHMQEKDLDAIMVIEQQCFPQGWSRNHFMAELSSANSFCIVTEISGNIAGYLCISFLLDEAEILNIAVDPACQRHGIGKSLLSASLQEAKNRGTTKVMLEVRTTSEAAINLYKNWGFIQSGIRKNYYEQNTDAILMDKTL